MSDYTVNTDRTGGIIPEGVHRFRVVEAEDKDGPAAPYWKFTLECIGGPFEGSMVWDNVSHSQAARFRMEDWLDAFNVPEGIDVDGDYFVGRTLRVKIKHEEWEGKNRPKADNYLPDTSNAPAPKVAKAKKGKAVRKKTEPVAEDGDEDEAVSEPEVKPLPEDVAPGTKKYKKAF